ncbi:MAG: hypothetical protein KY447_09845 [Actinobacteria bacterium]|nr:hypothetical protein [Actinomycetota bacterium]
MDVVVVDTTLEAGAGAAAEVSEVVVAVVVVVDDTSARWSAPAPHAQSTLDAAARANSSRWPGIRSG